MLIKNGEKLMEMDTSFQPSDCDNTLNGSPGDIFYVIVEQSGEFKWQASSSPIFVVE